MIAKVQAGSGNTRFGVHGHVRALKSGPAVAGLPQCKRPRSETETHFRLKQLAFLWAQAHGFSACAMEVGLPKCGYRADVAAYRRKASHGTQARLTRSLGCQPGESAVFECKQTICDLRRDNCHSEAASRRLDAICKRRHVLEERLRTHYPTLRNGDSLFPEFDIENFNAIGHRGYARLIREVRALQNQLYDCTKFEKLIRYRCANLFFIVLPEQLFCESEVPVGWGALIESNRTLTLVRTPMWQQVPAENLAYVLHRIAVAGTRNWNRQLQLDRD